MIKIISGWSNPGGSTTVFINLCNYLNSKKIKCIFYGPHKWHLNKCRADLLTNFVFNKTDIIIVHFLLNFFSERPDVKLFILSCHEKNLSSIKSLNYRMFDFIHFVNNDQYRWHGVNYPHVIIPNMHDDLKMVRNKPKDTAGIIGSIDENKQTYESILRALNAGYKKIKIFGIITNKKYFYLKVLPLILFNFNKVRFMGYCKDKQKMYNSLSAVFHSAKSEVGPYIKGECQLTGTKFFGNVACNHINPLISNEVIFEKWKKALRIKE